MHQSPDPLSLLYREWFSRGGVPAYNETVRHAKEPGGGYLPGSPLYKRQQRLGEGPQGTTWSQYLQNSLLCLLLVVLMLMKLSLGAAPDPELSPLARLVAAETVTKEVQHPMLAKLYRLTELCANFILPCGMAWFVDPGVMLLWLLVGWYLPAALRSKSPRSPLAFPVLNVAADDFSLVGLHPEQRDARAMYVISMARTLTCLLVAMGLSYMPVSVRAFLLDEEGIVALKGSAPDSNVQMLWNAASVCVVIATVSWLVATAAMIIVGKPFKVGSEKDSALLRKVEELGRLLQKVFQEHPADCHIELRVLKEQNPELSIQTSKLMVIFTICTTLSHAPLDVLNALQLFTTGWYLCGAILIIGAGITGYHAIRVLMRCSIVQEVRDSAERGVYTREVFSLLASDKGIAALPALAVKIYALPFSTAEGEWPYITALVAMASMALSVWSMSQFVVQQFDLGVEHEGL